MNEQIRELMGKTLDDKFRHTWSTMTHQDLAEFSEYFAELIVRECALQCNHNDDMDRILEHFGVEE